MSFEAIRWAIAAKTPSSSTKLLLIVMSDLTRAPRNEVFANATTLAEMTQSDRKTVLNGLHVLEQHGFIARTDKRYGQGGAPVFVVRCTASTGTEIGMASTLYPSDQGPGTHAGSGLGSEGSRRPTDTDIGTGSVETIGNEPIPFFPRTGTVFPENPSRFSRPNKPVVEPVKNQKEKERASNAANSTPLQDAVKHFPEVDEQTLADWLVVRNDKKVGRITATVAKGIRAQADKARLSVQLVIEKCCLKGWAGFDASWGTGDRVQPRGGVTVAQTYRERDEANAVERVRQMTGGLLNGDRKPDDANTIDMEAHDAARIGHD